MSSPGEALSLSPEQTRVLEENFRVSRHPDPASVMLIAAECGLTEDQTQKWFKLRNAKWREAEGLPAELGSVLD
ncbi:homeodomain-only protein [Menidia menidia]